MGGLDYMRFRVLYKLPSGMKAVQKDHVSSDLKELMQHLTTEGVTEESVQFLYVHYTPAGSNETMELVAVDNTVASNVVPIQSVRHLKKAADSKPRIRIALPPKEQQIVVVGQGLYHAVMYRG